MPDEEVSTMARLYAERLMRGDAVSESEMRVIMAGMMLSLDRLTHALNGFRDSLWSETKLRAIIGEEVEARCLSRRGVCPSAAPSERASFWGRFLRVLFGFR